MPTPMVLDLARLLPGPLAGRMLASLGFRVVRVLSPRGDLTEQAAPELYHWLAAGKETLTLDFKAEDGRNCLLRMVAEAQILLESNLPGAMERLGLGPDALRELNPRLVYVRVGGFPPPNEKLPGHDLTYLAASGMLSLLGDAWKHAQFADLCGAFWVVTAALEGLRKGGGTYEVNLANALAAVTYPPVPKVDGSALCYGIYECADGRVALAAIEPDAWTRLCESAGRPDWLDAAFSPTEANNPVYREFCAWLRSRTAAEWERWAEENRVSLRAVREQPLTADMPPWNLR